MSPLEAAAAHETTPPWPTMASGLPRPVWLSRLEQAILQEPLIASRPSRAGFDILRRSRVRPTSICVGIGLCSPSALGRVLPLDVLGLLLPAEALRRAMGAEHLQVLVADSHAAAHAFDSAAVMVRADAVVRSLLRIRRRLGLNGMSVTRASELARDPSYGRVLREVAARAGPMAPHYAVRQTADVVFAHRHIGPIVKVGWVMSPNRHVGSNRDEAAFDRCVSLWSEVEPAFVYVKAGRALDDARPKAPPYVELHPHRRINLHPGEDVARKLSTSPVHRQTLNGVKNHLRALTNTYARMVEPVRGSLADRSQQMLKRIYGPQRGSA
ncbi:MAG: hypothetical protein ACFB9M_03810 [Myxococcota bacterium]